MRGMFWWGSRHHQNTDKFSADFFHPESTEPFLVLPLLILLSSSFSQPFSSDLIRGSQNDLILHPC